VTRYARAFGVRWGVAYSDLDFREVLVAVWLLDDEERRALLLERGRDLQMGYYMNFAFNAPKELAHADRQYSGRLMKPASRRVATEAETALRDVHSQLQAVGRH
jgi:hypothetical protein